MVVEPERAQLIKKAIKANFDASPSSYDGFEQATGLFAFLADSLAEAACVKPGQKVVDAGCGTGISTAALLGIVGDSGHVTGMDLSPGMLDEARRRCSSHPNADFIEGDAEDIGALLEGPKVDAVLYNACIFLLPDPLKSLKGAFKVLRSEGTVGMNHIAGAYSGGMELFTQLFPQWAGGDFPSPRFPANTIMLESQLSSAGFEDIRAGFVDKQMGIEQVGRFYSIPAQSASLYPRLAAQERRDAVARMFELAREKAERSASLRWRWLCARK